MLKSAGVPYFAPYELRHTFATRLREGGVGEPQTGITLHSRLRQDVSCNCLPKTDWSTSRTRRGSTNVNDEVGRDERVRNDDQESRKRERQRRTGVRKT